MAEKVIKRCEQCIFGAEKQGSDFCPFCNSENSLIVKMKDACYSVNCKNCDFDVATTFFRPCYIDKTAPREEFIKYNECKFKI